MAIANKCDRCGKLFECRDGYLGTPIASIGFKNMYDVPKIKLLGIENDARCEYTLSSAELCYECYEDFCEWFRKDYGYESVANKT